MENDEFHVENKFFYHLPYFREISEIYLQMIPCPPAPPSPYK